MLSIRQAQEALAVFDRTHWRHVGLETIRHTAEHLRETISKHLETTQAITFHRSVRDNWHERFSREMPGVFIEHALRLANSVGEDLEAMLTASLCLPKEMATFPRWLTECWQIGRQTRRSHEQLFLDLIGDLASLDVACKMAGDAKQPHSQLVVWTACALMKYAVVFGPIAARPTLPWPHRPEAERLAEEFLLPFEQRLEELSERFEYARG